MQGKAYEDEETGFARRLSEIEESGRFFPIQAWLWFGHCKLVNVGPGVPRRSVKRECADRYEKQKNCCTCASVSKTRERFLYSRARLSRS